MVKNPSSDSDLVLPKLTDERSPVPSPLYYQVDPFKPVVRAVDASSAEF